MIFLCQEKRERGKGKKASSGDGKRVALFTVQHVGAHSRLATVAQTDLPKLEGHTAARHANQQPLPVILHPELKDHEPLRRARKLDSPPPQIKTRGGGKIIRH
jgi:hypothetical protein